jgi:hypothetical protein
MNGINLLKIGLGALLPSPPVRTATKSSFRFLSSTSNCWGFWNRKREEAFRPHSLCSRAQQPTTTPNLDPFWRGRSLQKAARGRKGPEEGLGGATHKAPGRDLGLPKMCRTRMSNTYQIFLQSPCPQHCTHGIPTVVTLFPSPLSFRLFKWREKLKLPSSGSN